MLRPSCVALLAIIAIIYVSTANVSSASAQAPEVIVSARSIDSLQVVVRTLGDKSELFGLTGPDTFLSNYGQFIDTTQPLVAAMTISTPIPHFVTEFSATNSQALFNTLTQEGFELNKATGELSKPQTALKFFVEQNGNRLRFADNHEILHKMQLPTGTQTGSMQGAAVTVQVDWRNLSLESRKAICKRGISLLLPTQDDWSVTYEGLPGLLSDLMTQRVATLMNRAERFTLQFSVDDVQHVVLTTDVLNRSVASARNVDSPFATVNADNALLSCQWNLPIESELRTLVGNWASVFAGDVKTFFRDEKVEDAQSWSALQTGAKIIAQNCKESIAFERLQGSLLVRESHGQPVVALGLRVANAARLDSDLRKLIQSAIEGGAPLSRPEYNLATSADLSLHRVQLILGTDPTSNDPKDGAYTITIGTSTHGLLVGIGPSSEKLVEELVKPTNQRSAEWLSFHWSQRSNTRDVTPASSMAEKLERATPALAIEPTAQGFRITTVLPAVDTKRSVQYTGTRNPESTLP